MNPYISKFLADVTLVVSPTFESASWFASGTGQRTATTAETRRLESRRYKTPALSLKDFCSACDYIPVPEKRTTETDERTQPKPVLPAGITRGDQRKLETINDMKNTNLFCTLGAALLLAPATADVIADYAKLVSGRHHAPPTRWVRSPKDFLRFL